MVIKNESTALESTYKKYNDILITFVKLIILMLLKKCTKKDCLIIACRESRILKFKLNISRYISKRYDRLKHKTVIKTTTLDLRSVE